MFQIFLQEIRYYKIYRLGKKNKFQHGALISFNKHVIPHPQLRKVRLPIRSVVCWTGGEGKLAKLSLVGGLAWNFLL